MAMSWLSRISWQKLRATRSGRYSVARTRRTIGSLETCESRIAMHTEGLLPSTSGHYTVSFASDGTQIADGTNQLTQLLQPLGDANVWQPTVLRALQTWASQTNADIAQVPDGGQAFGTPGLRRQDARFGDIRVGAVPLSADVMAITIPVAAPVAGTWNGDILLNSSAHFDSLDTLYAVMVHEAGHVFGLAHSDDPLSTMHVHGATPVTELTLDDIANLRSISGARTVDINETLEDNDIEDKATRLQTTSLPNGEPGTAPAVTFGDVRSAADLDIFRVETPSNYEGQITARLRINRLSLLTAQVKVYNADGELVTEATTPGAIGQQDLILQWQGDKKSDEYFVHVRGRDATASSIGGYALIVSFNDLLQMPADEIERVSGPEFRFIPANRMRNYFENGRDPRFDDDQHADDTPALGLELKTTQGFADSTRYDLSGTISSETDLDYYRFKSPELQPETARMSITITSESAEQLIPSLVVLDHTGASVPFQVLVNGVGELTVQVANLTSSSNYVLGISAHRTRASYELGNYRAGIQFHSQSIDLQSLASGQLTRTSAKKTHALYVAEAQLFHFLLDVPANAAADDAAIQMSLRDTAVRIVARPGETRSTAGVLLQPGTYQLDFQIAAPEGTNLDGVTMDYQLRGSIVSTPFGVIPIDPNEEPFFRCENVDNVFCFPGGIILEDPFLVDENGDPILGDPLVSDPNAPADNWWLTDQPPVDPPPPIKTPGDANLDGNFDSADLIQIFQSGQYEDEVVENSTWETGDFDGDLEFTTSDLILAFQEGIYKL